MVGSFFPLNTTPTPRNGMIRTSGEGPTNVSQKSIVVRRTTNTRDRTLLPLYLLTGKVSRTIASRVKSAKMWGTFGFPMDGKYRAGAVSKHVDKFTIVRGISNYGISHRLSFAHVRMFRKRKYSRGKSFVVVLECEMLRV